MTFAPLAPPPSVSVRPRSRMGDNNNGHDNDSTALAQQASRLPAQMGVESLEKERPRQARSVAASSSSSLDSSSIGPSHFRSESNSSSRFGRTSPRPLVSLDAASQDGDHGPTETNQSGGPSVSSDSETTQGHDDDDDVASDKASSVAHAHESSHDASSMTTPTKRPEPLRRGSLTPINTEHTRAKYEAYRALLDTGPSDPTTTLPPGETSLTLNVSTTTTVEDAQDQDTSDVGKLRRALRAVLRDAEDLVRQNLALKASHSELETKLKITTSNLQLAEMNFELLEEDLKRGRQGYIPVQPAHHTSRTSKPGDRSSLGTIRASHESDRSEPQPPPPPVRSSSTVPTSSSSKPHDGTFSRPATVRRKSSDGTNKNQSAHVISTRPGMEQRSVTLGHTASPESTSSEVFGLGSFFRRSVEKARPSGNGVMGIGFSSPSSSPTLPNKSTLGDSPPRNRAAAAAAVPPSPSHAEVSKLRSNLAQSQSALQALTSELETLKQAKSDLENEIESLSQALFEEANKMVADERKKHATILDVIQQELKDVQGELDQVRKEREAIKQTMILLEQEKSASPVDLTDSSNQDATFDREFFRLLSYSGLRHRLLNILI